MIPGLSLSNMKIQATIALTMALLAISQSVLSLPIETTKEQSLSITQNQQWSRLSLAIQTHSESEAIALIRDSQQINALSIDGHSPLFLSLRGKMHKLSVMLFNKNAQLTEKERQDEHIIFDAINTGHSALVSKLIQLGVPLNGSTTSDGKSAIYRTLEKQMASAFIALARAGSKFNDVDLSHGAPSWDDDRLLFTPMIWSAVNSGNMEFVRAMLQAGADVNAKDNNEWSVLHQAAFKGNLELAQLLIDHHADANAVDQDGKQPLLYAVYENHENVAQMLLDHGANVNQVSDLGVAPLHVASWQGAEETMLSLLDHGADVNVMDHDGMTPLHNAVLMKKAQCMSILLNHPQINVNAQNADGNTPLHFAVTTRFSKGMQLLIENGADLEIKDNAQVSPRDILGSRQSLGSPSIKKLMSGVFTGGK